MATAGILWCATGCSGSQEVIYVDRPVEVRVPIPVPDSTAMALRRWVSEQSPPPNLDTLSAQSSTSTIATEALLTVAWYKMFMRDLRTLLWGISNPVTDTEGNPIF